MRIRYRILATAIAMTYGLQSNAQELRTTYFMQTSDLRHEMNPALLDHSYVSFPLLGNINLGTTGNMGMKKFVYKMQPTWQGYGINGNDLTTFMHPNVDAADFLSGLKENNRMSVNFKMQILGFAFKAFGGYNSIDVNVRSNTNLCLPKSLFEFMKTAGEREDYSISKLGARSESFLELGLGHSHKVNDAWTVGGKLKLLVGAAYADLDVENVQLHMGEDQWHAQGKMTASSALMGMKVKTSHETDPNNPNRHRVDDIDTNIDGIGGFGAAVDLGATWKPIDNLTVSASLTDLGAISWKNTECMSSAGEWTFDGFEDDVYIGGSKENGKELGDQFDEIGDDLEDIFSLYYDGRKSQGHALSATLHLGAEYALPMYDKLRFGFLYTSRMAGQYAWHQGMISANIRPVKCLEVSLSGSASTTGVSGGLVLDLHAKRFNFFVGTDCFISKLSKQGIPLNKTNNNVSFGFGFPLGSSI